jgi:hypothetical protein
MRDIDSRTRKAAFDVERATRERSPPKGRGYALKF